MSANTVPVPDTEEVTGSIPVSPTMFVKVRGHLGVIRDGLFHVRTPTRTPTRFCADVGGRPMRRSAPSPEHLPRGILADQRRTDRNGLGVTTPSVLSTTE
jgi:hypothetical protein